MKFSNRQNVSDADGFRHHMREALKTASSEGLATGYAADDVKLGTFDVLLLRALRSFRERWQEMVGAPPEAA